MSRSSKSNSIIISIENSIILLHKNISKNPHRATKIKEIKKLNKNINVIPLKLKKISKKILKKKFKKLTEAPAHPKASLKPYIAFQAHFQF